MSPLLEISLAIVFCLWVIPLTWAVSSTIRSLPGLAKALIAWTTSAPANLIAYIRNGPSRYETYVEIRQQSLENAALDKDYQRIQDELIVQRQLVAMASATKRELDSNIQKLTEEIQGLQSTAFDISATQKEKTLVAERRESLLQLESDRSSQELKLEVLRIELEEKEAAVQLAYTYKLALIATHTADAASKRVKKILANDGTADVIRRMEEKVVSREAQAYATYFLEDHYVSFPSVAMAIKRLSINKLELEELKELLEALDQAATELHCLVQATLSYERVLRSQVEISSDEAINLAKRAEAVEQEGKKRAATYSKQLQTEYSKSALEFQTLLESSKICTIEFTQIHSSFAQKEREIFSRNAELERLDEKNSDNSEKEGDSKSNE